MDINRNILDRLTTAQLNSFIKYLQSPYYNKDSSLILYAEQRISEIKQGASGMVKIEAKEQKIQTQCLNFLVFENLKSNKSFEAQLKLSASRKRNLEKLYNGIISDIARLRSAEFDQSSDFFYNQFLIEKNLFELTTENEKKNAKVNIGASLNIDKIAFHLDIYYFLEKTKYFLKLQISKSTQDNTENTAEFYRTMYDFYKEKDCPLLNILLLTGNIASDQGTNSLPLLTILLQQIKSFIHHIPHEDAQLITDVLAKEAQLKNLPVAQEISDILINQIRFIESLSQPNLI